VEVQLDENSKNQQDQTKLRRDDATTYRKGVGDCVEAESLMQTAVDTLKKYYADMQTAVDAELGGAFVQKKKQEPPATWEGSYEGQSSQGTTVIEMIEAIIGENQKEEAALHDAEMTAQKDYEDSMAELKEEEKNLQTSLVDLKVVLAEKEVELQNKYEALDVASKEKVTIERYLEMIKPGCDFIETNYDSRKSNRETEKAALKKAVELLKATPAFASAVTAGEQAALGDCKS